MRIARCNPPRRALLRARGHFALGGFAQGAVLSASTEKWSFMRYLPPVASYLTQQFNGHILVMIKYIY